MITINNIEGLRRWNNEPTEEKPCVAEWYYDWIFDEVLKRKKFEEFEDAYNEMIRFTIICEKMDRLAAIELLNGNLRYWYNRASKDAVPFQEYFNKILIKNFGYQKS